MQKLITPLFIGGPGQVSAITLFHWCFVSGDVVNPITFLQVLTIARTIPCADWNFGTRPPRIIQRHILNLIEYREFLDFELRYVRHDPLD